MVPKLEGSVTEASLTTKTLTERGTFTSPNSPKSHQLGEHERQTATLACNTEISNNPQHNYASSYMACHPQQLEHRKSLVARGLFRTSNVERLAKRRAEIVKEHSFQGRLSNRLHLRVGAGAFMGRQLRFRYFLGGRSCKTAKWGSKMKFSIQN